jgi:hypothetical protein
MDPVCKNLNIQQNSTETQSYSVYNFIDAIKLLPDTIKYYEGTLEEKILLLNYIENILNIPTIIIGNNPEFHIIHKYFNLQLAIYLTEHRLKNLINILEFVDNKEWECIMKEIDIITNNFVVIGYRFYGDSSNIKKIYYFKKKNYEKKLKSCKNACDANMPEDQRLPFYGIVSIGYNFDKFIEAFKIYYYHFTVALNYLKSGDNKYKYKEICEYFKKKNLKLQNFLIVIKTNLNADLDDACTLFKHLYNEKVKLLNEFKIDKDKKDIENFEHDIYCQDFKYYEETFDYIISQFPC